MFLDIHSDTSYLSEPRARRRVADHFWLGSKPVKREPIKMNGTTYVNCGILKSVVSHVVEAELGTLFLDVKEEKFFCIALYALGHKQPPT